MSRTTTIVLAALLLGALLAYVFLSSAPAPVSALPARFLEFSPSEVQAVDLKSAFGEFRVERDPADTARWRLRVKDALVRADALQIEELLHDLSTLEPQNRFPDAGITPEERQRWELDNPTVEVRLALRPGAGGAAGASGAIRATFGKRTLEENHVYARRDGDAAAWIVPVSGPQAVERLRADNLRERRPVGFSSSDVQSLRLERPGRPDLVVERASRSEWRVESPFRGFAEPAAFETALARMVAIEVVDFVDDGSVDRDRYGLLEPRAVLTLRRQGSESPLVVSVGGAGPSGDVYFMEDGEPSVYSCRPAAAAAILDLDGAALRDTNLLRIGLATLESVEAVSPAAHWKLLRVMERWDVSEPQRVPAEQVEVDAMLEALRSLEAARFLDGEDPAAHSLRGADQAPGRIVVTAVDEGFSRTLLVGAEREDGTVPVRVLPGPGVPDPGVLALVDAPALSPFRLEWLAYRDREVHRVSLADFRGVARTTPDGTEEWRKVGAAWTAGAGTAGEPDGDALGVVQALLLSVRCRSWVAKAPGDFDRWGVGDKPSSAAITIIAEQPSASGGAPQEVRRTLLIGDPAPDGRGRYARMLGEEFVFILPEFTPSGGELRPFLAPLLAPWKKKQGE